MATNNKRGMPRGKEKKREELPEFIGVSVLVFYCLHHFGQGNDRERQEVEGNERGLDVSVFILLIAPFHPPLLSSALIDGNLRIRS